MMFYKNFCLQKIQVHMFNGFLYMLSIVMPQEINKEQDIAAHTLQCS